MTSLAFPGLLTINQTVTEMMQTYTSAKGVADKLFPIATMAAENDKIPQATISEYLRVPDLERADGSEVQFLQQTWNEAEYKMKEYAKGFILTRRQYQQAAAKGGVFSDIETIRFRNLRELFDLNREIRCYDEVTASGTSGNLAASQWDNATPGDPQADVMKNAEYIRLGTTTTEGIGQYPNLCVLGRTAWNAVQKLSTFKAFVVKEYGSLAINNMDTKLSAFLAWVGIPGLELAIVDKIKSTTKEGQTATAYTDVWAKRMTLAYVETPSRYMGFGHGFTFRKEIRANSWLDNDRDAMKHTLHLIEVAKIIKSAAICYVDVLS